MGLMDRILGLVFGAGGNAVVETAQLFRENADKGAMRAAVLQTQAVTQLAAEFKPGHRSGFDAVMDGVNRLPRPALALGTLGLFASAMVNPLWFAERMQGIALVPEPLWWLLGVIVSFYFGARHQIKSQNFQREIAQTMARVPQVIENVATLRALRFDTPGVADTGADAGLSLAAVEPGDNPALIAWQQARVRPV
ncbi:MAG: holin family protein [Pseudomonadota bacterium]